jgi:LemA protein
MKSNNKVLLAFIAVVGLVILAFIFFYLYGTSVYDGAVERKTNLDKSWDNVQAVYQRRADLVPNLVATVQGAADNEKEILTEVTKARAGMANATTPAELQQQGDIINRNIAVVFEKYPEIRSTENFQKLQDELAGTENRISTERIRYNEAVQAYNAYIKGFWRKKALGLVSDGDEEFTEAKGFEAEAGSDKAPEVKFN